VLTRVDLFSLLCSVWRLCIRRNWPM